MVAALYSLPIKRKWIISPRRVAFVLFPFKVAQHLPLSLCDVSRWLCVFRCVRARIFESRPMLKSWLFFVLYFLLIVLIYKFSLLRQRQRYEQWPNQICVRTHRLYHTHVHTCVCLFYIWCELWLLLLRRGLVESLNISFWFCVETIRCRCSWYHRRNVN